MKKILTILTLMTAFSTGAQAEDKLGDRLNITDTGAIYRLGNSNNSIYGLELANTGAAKRTSLAQDDSTSSITSGNETSVGFSYDHPINEKFNTNFKFSYRNDADNNLGASDGAAMLHFKYKWN